MIKYSNKPRVLRALFFAPKWNVNFFLCIMRLFFFYSNVILFLLSPEKIFILFWCFSFERKEVFALYILPNHFGVLISFFMLWTYMKRASSVICKCLHLYWDDLAKVTLFYIKILKKYIQNLLSYKFLFHFICFFS